MKAISIHDAKTNLSKYIAAAKKGEKVYIGSHGMPEVQLVKLPSSHGKSGKRSFNALKGKIVDNGDAFSATTDAEIAKMMLQ